MSEKNINKMLILLIYKTTKDCKFYTQSFLRSLIWIVSIVYFTKFLTYRVHSGLDPKTFKNLLIVLKSTIYWYKDFLVALLHP